MAAYYLHVPSPTERGGLTAKEILYAQMPCHFGLQDCTTGNQFFNGWLQSLTDDHLFPTFVLYWEDPENLPEDCTFCGEVLGMGFPYRLIPCGHIFHLPCIDRWLRFEDASCPLCRRTLYYLRRPRVVFMLETSRTTVPEFSMSCLRDLKMWLLRKILAE